MDVRAYLREIFNASIETVDPYRVVKSYLERNPNLFNKGVYIVGFGKAASRMALACEDVIGENLRGGYLITKYGHAEKLSRLIVKEAAHPVPDENSLKYTQELIELVESLSEKDCLICLISGGGSALLCKPCEGLYLSDKQSTTDMLLKAGADIFELNTVRKHLSDVKGGRILKHVKVRRMTSLILSDVLGDRLDVIASGATSYDESTYRDALDIVLKYGINGDVPERVMRFLKSGADGAIPETLKYGDPVLGRVDNIILGNLNMALHAAAERASSLGMEAVTLEGFVTGEAVAAGRELGSKIIKIKGKNKRRPLCIISGGETTVTVRGNGVGGRNMELALSCAKTISGLQGVAMLSAGTDGGDGPTDAAGGIVDGDTVQRGKEQGLDIDEYLDNNDSYNYLKKEGGLYITGPTGTNVMDIQVVIIE